MFAKLTGGTIAIILVVMGWFIHTQIPVPISETDIGDPENVKIITADYDAFWQTYDETKNADGTVDKEKFDKLYQSRVTGDLDGFSKRRYGDPKAVYNSASLAPFYNSYRNAYPADTFYNRDEIIAGYKKLRDYMPHVKLPNVHIFMGLMNNGGTITENNLIIAHEIYIGGSADWNAHPRAKDPKKLAQTKAYFAGRLGDNPKTVDLIMHEMIHYAQGDMSPLKTFLRKASMAYEFTIGGRKLLSTAMIEGNADFLQYVLTGRRSAVFVMQEKWAQDNNKEQFLFEQFAQNLDSTDLSLWLYNMAPADGRPADMGYWMGHKIAEAYWEQASDKKQAFNDLVNALSYSEFKAIFDKADYGKKFK